MEFLLEGSIPAIKQAAAQGRLTWKGKKVILDPFLPLGFFYEISSAPEGGFYLTPRITLGSRVESIESYEMVSSLGGLQGGTFRFWQDSDLYEVHPPLVSPLQLDKLIKEGLAHRFKGEALSLKPAPLPILKLLDRTGGFADLYLDYGAWGEKPFHEQNPTLEEKHWENDLLETGFKKKKMGSSHYFCPLDQVGASIAFLVEMGWKVLDFRGKRVRRQEAIVTETYEEKDAILLRGHVRFGDQEIPIQEVVGSFERRERWMDLSPHEVGLIELPSSWEPIVKEERMERGICIRRCHAGILEDIASLPPHYQPVEWKEVVPTAAFRGELFPFQQKGISWLYFLYQSGFSGLLADEMGLGKTIQLLSFLTLREGRVLVVMPVTLLSLWKEQIERFLPHTSFYMHQGTSRKSDLEGESFILTSYAILRQDLAFFQRLTFDCVILDEAQMIKNASTQIAQSVFQLKSRFRVALTGTPIENRREEIDSIFRFLMPELVEITNKKIKPFMLRRTKEEVGLDLPAKIIQVMGVDPSDEEYQLYEELLCSKRTELMKKIEEEGLPAHRMEVLELILRLRQLACHPSLVYPTYQGEPRKFTQVVTDIEEVATSGKKLLLYSQFTSVLHLFQKQLDEKGIKYSYLDGSTRDRERSVRQFQNDPSISVFLISLKAGGVGLNLQAADYVFLYDPWWNSAAEAQAIDRAHRVGRGGTVIARKYYTTHTIEAKILDLQAKKTKIAEELWEESSAAAMTSFEEIMALLL